MSTIVDIRSSLIAKISELEAELSPLREALDALGQDDNVVHLVTDIVVTDEETPANTLVKNKMRAMTEAKEKHPRSEKLRNELYQLLLDKYTAESALAEVKAEKVSPKPNRSKVVGKKRNSRSKSREYAYGERQAAIMELLDQGLSVPEIAEELDANPNYVYKVRRDWQAA